MTIRGGVVCQGVAGRRILPEKIDHSVSYVCVLARLGGALNERWVLTPTQTQEIPPLSNTITAVITHCRCRVYPEMQGELV